MSSDHVLPGLFAQMLVASLFLASRSVGGEAPEPRTERPCPPAQSYGRALVISAILIMALALYLPPLAAEDHSSSLAQAVENILQTLKNAEIWPPDVNLTTEERVRAKLMVSLIAEREEHMIHLIEEWRHVRSPEWVTEHLPKCTVCLRVKDILRDLDQSRVDSKPLIGATLALRNQYKGRLWNEYNTMRSLSTVQAQGILDEILSTGALYDQVITCRRKENCRPSQDFNALVASNSRIENDLSALYTKLGRLDEALVHSKRALRIYPEAGPPNYNIGRVYYLQGQLGLAFDHWEIGLEAGIPKAAGRLAKDYKSNPAVSKTRACSLARTCFNSARDPRLKKGCANLVKEICP